MYFETTVGTIMIYSTTIIFNYVIEKEGPYEDIGKTVGWGTITAMGTAGLIFPLRRSMKKVNRVWKSKNLMRPFMWSYMID